MERWDLVVVGAGPAGSAAALGALRADPGLRVPQLDRRDFPRDKRHRTAVRRLLGRHLRHTGAGSRLPVNLVLRPHVTP